MFLVVVAGLLMLPGPVLWAAEGMLLSLPEMQLTDEEEIKVEVTVENAAGSQGGQFVLAYDSNFLLPQAVSAGPVILEAQDNLYMSNLEYGPGQLGFMWVTAAEDSLDSGLLCTVTFSVLAEGESALILEEITASPAGFAVAEPLPGLVSNLPPAEEPAEEDESLAAPAAEDNGEGDSGGAVTLWVLVGAALLGAAGYYLHLRRRQEEKRDEEIPSDKGGA